MITEYIYKDKKEKFKRYSIFLDEKLTASEKATSESRIAQKLNKMGTSASEVTLHSKVNIELDI